MVIQKLRTEKQSRPHATLRSYPGNSNESRKRQRDSSINGIEHPASTGVIYVMDRAMRRGYTYGDPAWANFGQGAPEVGPIPGGADKATTFTVSQDSFEYAPTAGITSLRKAVANLYNNMYRQGKASQYTYENVCIVPGGRAGLTRVAAVVGDVNVGYFLPEYTAYEQMLSVFKKFVPIPTPLDEDDGYHVHPKVLRKEITGRGLGVVVISNPRNPTGQMVEGEELKEVLSIVRERSTTLVMDEFYSAYVYDHPEEEDGRTVSAAEYIEDVNTDPVIIVDGLTKNLRLPGWRVCWLVAPKSVVSSMQAAGSFLEGGANHPLQEAAIPLLDPDHYRSETRALQKHFRAKRNYVLGRLNEMGLRVKFPPQATFYIWLDLSSLPTPLDSGLHFFEECLKEKVILVPGIFFDINPSQRRELFDSPCHHFVRLSFGPPMDELVRGMDGMQRVVERAGVSTTPPSGLASSTMSDTF
ncbi:aminotransferase [Piptocephalis cylindrospora]|uniref:Aminotransferase n=1 Tax=Piptocephalis cylindrospora TaxID=1907219 RepID=A0A4P9Y7S4_9FUNG|nr:aminotransferase [Piptocephalis cylindrospora]|eukprot:RKP15196.1 aminotransferase [Piptocephalis cylindrospora]